MHRHTAAAALAVLAATVLAACGGSSSSTTSSATTTTTAAAAPQRIAITVRDGKIVGGRPVEASVREGTPVVLVVHADVSDEVHLHGYDLHADVAPGTPARIVFTASIAGRFEAELESRGFTILHLQVS